MSQYGVIWMEEALQKLQQENTRLRQENAKLRQEWDQLLEALEELEDHDAHRDPEQVRTIARTALAKGGE